MACELSVQTHHFSFHHIAGGADLLQISRHLLILEPSYKRNTDSEIIQWMKAPEAVGRRFPEDMASCYSLRALKDFLENRGGKWEDWHLGMLAQQ